MGWTKLLRGVYLIRDSVWAGLWEEVSPLSSLVQMEGGSWAQPTKVWEKIAEELKVLVSPHPLIPLGQAWSGVTVSRVDLLILVI